MEDPLLFVHKRDLQDNKTYIQRKTRLFVREFLHRDPLLFLLPAFQERTMKLSHLDDLFVIIHWIHKFRHSPFPV
jgi:hypothetical protein